MENKETVLVTGATGFVGMQIILQLLEKGYTVKATVRDVKSEGKVRETLRKNNVRSLEKLSFVAAELTQDNNWEEAMQGCNYVLSVASPIFFDTPKNEEEAFRPAREGILRILKYAKKASVKRVVMTSNFGAVGFTQTDKSRETTEADWTDTRNNAVSVYERSKTLAEKAAWEFIRTDGGNLEFATINPVAILGPSLDAHVSGSFHLLQNLLNGKMKAIPNIPLNIVDVRDVADLHIKAMEIPEANEKRFIVSADGQISLPEIAELLKRERPELSRKVSSKRVPNFVLSIASLFNHQAKEGVLLAKMNRNLSTRNAKSILNWKPVATQEETILAAVDTLKKYDLL
ncbi:SDR family oxidoreductase [Pedobacter endophyticus]|uniref:Aldehyde reductase n=1 Tax=Pedobacter endophyticus TaxID=2789740 RepID=A0A7U3SPJ6_9SPHI|nr:aldehyde reductase [Pedobacter endophyticus]QPH38688.1 aldehyde reductase [Pedobacter endophyticus]